MNVLDSKAITTFAKLAFTGATVFAIGWIGLTVGDTKTGVKEAQADIWSLDFAPKSRQQRFVETLMDEGMEKPRAYDFNGNQMFFSTATTNESPVQVLRRFQDGFVRHGVNKKRHDQLPPALQNAVGLAHIKDAPPAERQKTLAVYKRNFEHLNGLFSGEVVPMQVSRNRVMMMGTGSNDGAKKGIEFLHESLTNLKKGKDPINDTVDVMRYVEAYRQPNGKTRINAIYSDENLDLDKFKHDTESVGTGVSSTVPSCLGCKRMFRVKGESEQEYAANGFESHGTPADSMAFYDRALANRGWHKTDASKFLDEARRRGAAPDDALLANYSRDGRFITLIAYPDEHGSVVQAFESN